MTATKRSEALKTILNGAGIETKTDNIDQMALHAIKTWCPQPTQQWQLNIQLELHMTLLLCADRAAKHLFYWNNGDGREWTPNIGLYTQVYYNLACFEDGLLIPDGLAQQIFKASQIHSPTFLDCLLQNASKTLHQCSSSLTKKDLEMPELADGNSLFRWAVIHKNTPATTRWRQVQSLIEKRRIPAQEWKI